MNTLIAIISERSDREPFQQVHTVPFQLERAVHITVERCFHVGVTENLAERFRVKAAFYAPCGEGMAQSVERHAVESAQLRYFAEVLLHKPRLDHLHVLAREEVAPVTVSAALNNPREKVGQRDRAV